MTKTDSKNRGNNRNGGGFIENLREQITEDNGPQKKEQSREIFSADETEIKKRHEEEMREFFFQRKTRERLVFSSQDREVKTQIAAIRQELLSLAKSVQALDKEIGIAAQLEPIEPGVYHLNYFIKLREAITEILKRTDESVTWLSNFNRRAQRRNIYWGRVKKSGTKFMLSQERYVATQTG